MHECCGADKKACACASFCSLSSAGRILFSVPFIIFGLGHLLNGPALTGTLAGWPFALFFVYVSGAGLLLTGIALLLNRYARLAATLLAIELGIFIVAVFVPGFFVSGADLMTNTMYLLKDTALLGAALAFAAQLPNRGFSGK